jgi:hypothetical protein
VPLRVTLSNGTDDHTSALWNSERSVCLLMFPLQLAPHRSQESPQTIANAYHLCFPCSCHSRCCAPFPRSSRARTSRPRTDYTSRNAWRRTTSLAWLRRASSPGRPPWRGSRSGSRYSIIRRLTRRCTLSGLAITPRFLRCRPQLLDVIIKQSAGYRSGHPQAGTGARCCGGRADGGSRRVERTRHGEW